MPNQAPMWWMRSGPQRQHPPVQHPSAPPVQPPLPEPLPPPPVCQPVPPNHTAPPPSVPPAVSALTDRLRRMDGETLLLLALLWLLWQEHADPKLLLALAYIAL